MDTSTGLPARDPHKAFIVNYAPIFAKLDTLEKDIIIQRSKVVEYGKRDIIYRQNDAPDAFYCVISGRVRIYNRLNQHEVTLEYLNCGKYFGMISLLTGEPHSVSAEAANDSKMLRITKEDFREILEKIPRLAIDLSRTLSRRLRGKEIRQKRIFESTILSVFSLMAVRPGLAYAMNLALSLRKETGKNVILLNISKDTKEIKDCLGEYGELSGGCAGLGELKDLSPFPTEDTLSCATLKNGSLEIGILNIYHEPQAHTADFSANLNTLITHLTGDYHYVIANMSGQMDEVCFKLLKQSDIIHIIADCTKESVLAVKGLITGLDHPQEKLKVIMRQGPAETRDQAQETTALLGYKVYASLPSDEAAPMASGKTVMDIADTEYARTVRRVSRELGDVRLGLALSGGAALGLAHIGVLKVLEKENIPVDMVVGSSMGAFIGALWAVGLSAAKIEEIAMEFDGNKKKVLHLLADPRFPKLAFFKGNRIASLLRRHIGDKTFYDLKRPFKVIACNLNKRQEFVFDSGRLIDAVMASIAIPGVFNPRWAEGDLLIDGGIIEPVPLGSLVRMGIKKIIAVNVLPSPESVARNYEIAALCKEEEKKSAYKKGFIGRAKYDLGARLDRLLHPNILDIIVNSIQTLEYIIGKNDSQKADIVISPDVTGVEWFEFFCARKLINSGEQEAAKAVSAIKALVSE